MAGECLVPYSYPKKFDDQYDCFIEGYNQSILKWKKLEKKKLMNMKFILDLYVV